MFLEFIWIYVNEVLERYRGFCTLVEGRQDFNFMMVF